MGGPFPDPRAAVAGRVIIELGLGVDTFSEQMDRQELRELPDTVGGLTDLVAQSLGTTPDSDLPRFVESKPANAGADVTGLLLVRAALEKAGVPGPYRYWDEIDLSSTDPRTTWKALSGELDCRLPRLQPTRWKSRLLRRTVFPLAFMATIAVLVTTLHALDPPEPQTILGWWMAYTVLLPLLWFAHIAIPFVVTELAERLLLRQRHSPIGTVGELAEFYVRRKFPRDDESVQRVIGSTTARSSVERATAQVLGVDRNQIGAGLCLSYRRDT